jgi:hypothetical protein
MKFTDYGRKVVIHLVRSLPPKISRDKKTITILLSGPLFLLQVQDEFSAACEPGRSPFKAS